MDNGCCSLCGSAVTPRPLLPRARPPAIPTPQRLWGARCEREYGPSQGRSAVGFVTIPLKPRDWRAAGGWRESRNEQVNFTDY